MRFLSSLTLIAVGAGLGWIVRGFQPGEPNAGQVAAAAMPELAPSVVESAPSAAVPLDDKHLMLQLLEDERFGEAVGLLGSVRSLNQPRLTANYEHVLLKYLERMRNGGMIAQSRVLLEAIVDSFPDMTDAQIMLAAMRKEAGEYDMGLRQLYGARIYVARVEQLRRIDDQIAATVAAYDAELHQCCESKRRVEVYQDLVALDPSRTPYYIALAEAYRDSGQFEQARQTLLAVVHDGEVGARARELLAQQAAGGGAGEIPLSRRGNQFFVTAKLNDELELELLLDTGASVSVLSSAAFSRLSGQPRFLGRQTLRTVNGVAEARMYRLESLEVGNKQVQGTVVAVVDDMDSRDLAGLLGMDFLDHFRLSLDQQRGVLQLQPRSTAGVGS